MSSRTLSLTDDAKLDIQGLLRSTRRRWGAQQQRRYEQQLSAAMERLLQYPQLGRRTEASAPGLRAHHVGQHVIYYLVSYEAVTVIRVLHAKMEARDHFDLDPE